MGVDEAVARHRFSTAVLAFWIRRQGDILKDPMASIDWPKIDGMDALAELALNLRWSWNHSADELWGKLNRKPPTQASPEPDAGGAAPFESKDQDKSRVGDWQTELEEKKAAFQEEAAAEGQLREFSSRRSRRANHEATQTHA